MRQTGGPLKVQAIANKRYYTNFFSYIFVSKKMATI